MSNLSKKSGCLGIFLDFLQGKPNANAAELTFPYGLKDAFLSPAERSFFGVLQKVIPKDQYLLTKVNLSDLFYVKRPHENRASRNRIDRKHVDFVICRSDTMQPVIGIELDDKSHNRVDRQKRDALVDQVFKAAGLSLIHVKAQKSYNVEEIKAQITHALK